MRKLLLFFTTLFFVCAYSIASLPFNNNLSENEIALLHEGKVLVRNIGSSSKMCLASNNEGAKQFLKDMEALKPSYLAEVIQIRPYKGNEDLPEKLEDTLMDVAEYVGIPYYSEQHGRYFDLYSAAKIISDSMREDGVTRDVKAHLTMAPFGLIDTSIKIVTPGDYVYYITTNENTLYYSEKIKCVKPQKMKSGVLLFRDGDNWILYGAGGVNAIKVVFLEKRIETSFINRIKTFCNFIFEKL
ncbi:MAG: hypothetical protein IJR50_03175 [Treponema sp.]|nr:hypothetical protein [Treponema sp.]